MKKIIAHLILISILNAGCTIPVRYSLKGVEDYPSSQFSQKKLIVHEFKDVRAPDGYPLAKKDWKNGFTQAIVKDGVEWYKNSDGYYLRQRPVASYVSRAITKHIKASKLFKGVELTSSNEKQGDYLLEGTIKKFLAYKERAVAPELAMGFGLAGALATLGVKSRFEAETVLVDIVLTDMKSQSVIWSGQVEGKTQGENYADPDGFSVFERANDSLRIAVNNLTKELRSVKI